MGERRWWPTMVELAAAVCRELDAGDDDHAMRLLIDGVNQLADAHAAGRADEAVAEPPASVGDPRWDALLAGSVRYRLHSLGETPPAWTLMQPLATAWWPVDAGPRRAAHDSATAPAELSGLGVYLSERDFSQA